MDQRSENGKKRVRATQACVLCRKKKIKCDGTKPECLHCQESHTQCEYTESKKRGPRKGYVQLLEERLAQMERRVVQLGGTTALLNESTGDESASSTQSVVPSPISYTKDPAQRIADENEGLPQKETIMHLVDLFFKYINSVFPIVHRPTLRRSIEDGTVSKPLLWSVLAIAARYSDDPSIKTDPPYWAGEAFALKATSLIDASLFEPTLPNLQFWGIMACLEYGRASGSKAWIYAGLAARFCQELGLNKEETLSTPILAKDGTIDTTAMALKRRIFWSCFCIDKFASAGTGRPQAFSKNDIEARPPNIPESLVLRDPDYHISVTDKRIVNDSLMDISRHYIKIVEIFGEVTTVMKRSKSDSTSITWPPVPQHASLDAKLRSWKDDLPERFHFTEKNLDFHKDSAGSNYFNTWLSMHAVWCSSLMVLHRGSLAYGDVRPADVEDDVYRAIQTSIEACKMSVRTATGVFRAMRDMSGCNVLPFMGYSAYVFATVLMTSTFSKGPDACRRSSEALKILCDLIERLRPYWPMCERLAITASDLLVAHSRLYQPQNQQQAFPYPLRDEQSSQSYSSAFQSTTPSSTATASSATTPSILAYPKPDYFMPYNPSTSAMTTAAQQPSTQIPPASTTLTQQQPSQNPPFPSILNDDLRNYGAMPGDIDFDSLDFLNDSALFGQIMFDVSRPMAGQSTMATAFAYPGIQGFATPDPVTAQQLYTPQPYTSTAQTQTPRATWSS